MSRAVAQGGVPGISDLANLDVTATDQIWQAVNGTDLQGQALTTDERIQVGGSGYLNLMTEAGVIYSGMVTAELAAGTASAYAAYKGWTSPATTNTLAEENVAAKNVSNSVGDWGVNYAEENMGITAKQWSNGPGRRWDGYVGQSRPVEVKTTTTNRNFSLNPRIRGEIAADRGQNTLWTFVGGRGVSNGLQAELQGAGLSWVGQGFLPGVDWQNYFKFQQ